MDSVFLKQGDANAQTGPGNRARFRNLSTSYRQPMKRLAGRQTRFVNALEKRSGSLWEGRYKISPINTDAYSRFVECEGSSKSDELIAPAINSNKLTGGEKFVDAIESRIGVRIELRKPGRPTSGK